MASLSEANGKCDKLNIMNNANRLSLASRVLRFESDVL
jgi:hypothetical protein